MHTKKHSTISTNAVHSSHLESAVSRSLHEFCGGSALKNQKGFSLIELLIVVAIILIIAAIAIPNLMRSRMAANEASAVSSVRSLNTAQIAYNATFLGYASSITVLGPPGGSNCTAAGSATSVNACLIDNVLQTGTKAGYLFTVAGTGTPVTNYTTNADPVNQGTTGQRHFYSDSSGVIRYNASAPATSADVPIQ